MLNELIKHEAYHSMPLLCKMR